MNEKEVLERGYAKTLPEWWFLVDHHWDNLISIVGRYCPERRAQAMSGKENRNAYDVYTAMNHAWFNAPDNSIIHSIPGWGQLCDLCSDFPANKEEGNHDGQESH